MNLLAYISFPDREEAISLGRALVENGLAAGINIFPGICSIYHWKGEIRQKMENVLIAQTTSAAYPRLEAFVAENHSYETPCLVAMPIEKGYPAFMDWIALHAGKVK